MHAAVNTSKPCTHEESLTNTAGFTRVFEMMRDSNKPAVGHNLSYDLTFTLSSFAQSLPPTWPAYKQLVQQWFPAGVWDTKHLGRQLDVSFLLVMHKGCCSLSVLILVYANKLACKQLVQQ